MGIEVVTKYMFVCDGCKKQWPAEEKTETALLNIRDFKTKCQSEYFLCEPCTNSLCNFLESLLEIKD